MLISSSVTDKHCADCGQVKPIADFDVITKNGKQQYGTYCKEHRRARNNTTSKKRYAANRESILQKEAIFRKSPEYNKKQSAYKKKEIEQLTDGIVVSWLAKKLNLSTEDVKSIPGLIEAERARLTMLRKLKLLTNKKEGWRICSHCCEEKPVDEFRKRTERRKGKNPYTYRSGQCKKCESKIKNSYGKK